MSQVTVPFLIRLYRALGVIADPAVGFYLKKRFRHGKEELNYRARYGYAEKIRPVGTLIWLHAASIGETAALIPLIKALQKKKYHILLTTHTVTSAYYVQQNIDPPFIYSYVPLDIKKYLTRFLNHWQPDLFVGCESEIWPTRILELYRRSIPQLIVNGRISDRSYRFWKKIRHTHQYLFQCFNIAFVQTLEDKRRYKNLGTQKVLVVGNLKVEAPLISDPHWTSFYQKIFKDRLTWAAISTHEGEEMALMNTHIKLCKKYPNLLLVLVPRHPERVLEIKKKFLKAGLAVGLRTEGLTVDKNMNVFLGDTIGEMALYLQLVSVAFVGNSLKGTKGGGHNPLEPIRLGVAVLSGNQTQNFFNLYKSLSSEKAVCIIEEPDQIFEKISFLIENPSELSNMVIRAHRFLDQMQGVTSKIVEEIEPFLKKNPIKD